jgi:hypothetical protein
MQPVAGWQTPEIVEQSTTGLSMYPHMPPVQKPGFVYDVNIVPLHDEGGGLVQSVFVMHAPGGRAQSPFLHVALWQSVPVRHFKPVAHAGHIPPPQSTSVSAPSLMPSAHVFTVAEQMPAAQIALQQLALVMHGAPSGEHICMGEHTPLVQVPLQQGAFIAQA